MTYIGPERRTAPRERQPKAYCPKCQHFDSLVYGGDYDEDVRAYVRYRRCVRCRHSFRTEETLRRP
jgi:transcriptional regulator NrdR family protein